MMTRVMNVAARALGCVLAALVLMACSTPAPPKSFNLAGYSAVYKRGHADGCVSADRTQRRDERLYRDDADYMMGWNDGRSACAKRK